MRSNGVLQGGLRGTGALKGGLRGTGALKGGLRGAGALQGGFFNFVGRDFEVDLDSFLFRRNQLMLFLFLCC